MPSWLRAVLLGILSWFLPFVVSFVLFPVKKANPTLFSSLMFLIVLVAAGLLFRLYFRHHAVILREAALVGVLWTAINLVCDFPMFSAGPMKMTAFAYYSEIGLVYLTFPIFALLAAPLGPRR